MIKYSILTCVIITLIIVFSPQTLHSQTDFWTQTVLTSGRFDAIVINNSGHVFAGGEGRGTVYRSTDNGYSWDQVNLNLAFNISSFELSTDRSPGGLIFAGTDYGIFLSYNNGNS